MCEVAVPEVKYPSTKVMFIDVCIFPWSELLADLES